MTEPKFKHAFFIPYKGDNYSNGINGKKVLVLGASFYCEEGEVNKECHGICTNPNKRATADFKDKCPYCKRHKKNLSEKAEIAISIEKCDAISYQNFEIFLQAVLLKEDPWDYVAFTNYVQFMLPTKETRYKYFSDIDYEAIVEVVQKITPDVIIVWGGNVKKHLEKKIPKIKQKLSDTDGYSCSLELEGINVTMVFLRHPSAHNWGEVLRHSYEYVKQALI